MTTLADQVARTFAARFGDRTGCHEWFVPGRVELLGKHVDYAGGRSLLAATERGFHVMARPRRDARVHLVDSRSQQAFSGALDRDAAPQPGTWHDYVISVLRRLARDFPGAGTGMDAVIGSSLPSAAGVSSSSALVVATFLPLARFNHLADRAVWGAHLDSPAARAGYLGAVENGKAFGPFAADFGVGTAGGSQDHLAILCCRAGHLTRARFLPAAVEEEVPFPDDWTIAVAASGVAAPKGGAVREHYNALAAETAALLAAWNRACGTTTTSLLDVLTGAGDDGARLADLVRGLPEADTLLARLDQFRTETTELIPRAIAAIRQHDPLELGVAIDRSHALAVGVLRNQVAETRHLADHARQLGAIAASAFGAGFGGSVYAVVPRPEAEGFLADWSHDYRHRFPVAGARAEFFVSGPSEGARELA